MGMLLPPDWDRASADNGDLCASFLKKSYFKNNRVLNYRLFEPEMAGREKIPLVLYLHGADAAGDDNKLQLSMHDIGTYLARDHMVKRHPCYILAPQYGTMMHWAMPDIKDLLWELVVKITDEYPDIDKDRLYIYGYSAGGVGTLRLIKEHPGIFAAALSICGATGAWDIDNITKTPLYMVHAADDMIVRSTYRPEQGTSADFRLGNYGSADIYERFKDSGMEIYYDEYPEGWMHENYHVNPHCSWVAVSDKRSMKIWDWMFDRRLDQKK